ncbi:MAG: HD domain-containing protein, partial [Deltaproteobacteria bacterium]|nr:HD domain-containing protein [Deltaproteobacteria bacterium]
GGAFRYLLLNRPVHDYDLALAEPLENLAKAVAQQLDIRPILLGHGLQSIYRLVHHGQIVDLCPLAEPIEKDLLRRDLTVNALAVNLSSPAPPWTIIDPTDGQADIARRVVKFISEAVILADPLRLLRLFRFGAVLDFKLDEKSLALVTTHARLINQIAGERIHEELWQLLDTPRSRVMLEAMFTYGFLTEILPEIKPLIGCGQSGYHHLDVWNHTRTACCFLEEFLSDPEQALPSYGREISDYLATAHCPALLKFTILLHDFGKPGTRIVDGDHIQFHGHEILGADLAAGICRRIKTSVTEAETIQHLIRHHLRPFHLL